MSIERRFGRGRVGVEKRAGAEGRISGHAAVFYDGTPETEFRLWEGMVERILPGAFDRATEEDDVVGLFNHDANHVLGRTSAGTMTLSIDDAGLRYEIDPPDTTTARDVRTSIGRGDITGSSFGFIVTEETFSKEGGEDVREIRGVELRDVGPVTFPAYSATSTQARAVVEARMAEALGAKPETRGAFGELLQGQIDGLSDEETDGLAVLAEAAGIDPADIEALLGDDGACPTLAQIEALAPHVAATAAAMIEAAEADGCDLAAGDDDEGGETDDSDDRDESLRSMARRHATDGIRLRGISS